MRLTLISPPLGAEGHEGAGIPVAPPVIEYLAGLTTQLRPDVEIAVFDGNKHAFDPAACDADLVGITVLTPQAPWAYRTADALRERGHLVVLGGLHVGALPDEAAAHADAIVLGEAETVWGDVLDDAAAGRLRSVYTGGRPELVGLPPFRHDLWPDFYPIWSFFTSRGCPHGCGFCSVHEFFGTKPRFRPIDEVVGEVAASKGRLFFNIDDNVWGISVPRSIELYSEMARQVHLKWWFGQADLATAQHPRADELLTAVRRSGGVQVMVGYESENPLVLEELSASSKQGRDRLDAIRRIRSHGIDVGLFIIVGTRAGTMRDFEAVIDLCDRLDAAAHPIMAIPLPGTKLYEEYRPYLIDGMDWDTYDGCRALFVHDDPEMTPEARETAVVRLQAALYTWPQILRRVSRISVRGFPMAHVTSLMMQSAMGRAFKKWAADHERALCEAQPGDAGVVR